MEQLLGGAGITYLGHATFQLTTPGNERIIIDPFITGNPQFPEDFGEIGELDTILLTHGHSDHFGDTLSLAARTNATVVANFETFAFLQSEGVENAMPLNKGGTARVGGITVTGTNAFHSSSIETDEGTTIYAGEPMGFVIEFESGFKLYHAGDTCVFGDMALIRELYAPDLAMLPIGNSVVMSPFEAAHATRLLGVQHVVPIHYGTFPFLPGTPEEFQNHLSDLGLSPQVHVLKPGESLTS